MKKNILIIMTSHYIKNLNGAYTYIDSLITLLGYQYNFFIYTDSYVENKYSDIIIYDKNLLIDLNIHYVITNDMFGLKNIENINYIKKHIHLTHNSNLINPTEYDDECLFIYNNSNINICTQSNEFKNLLIQYGFKNNIYVLKQPVIINDNANDGIKMIYNYLKKDILIISSSEDRKNYDMMLNAISKTNYSLTIVTNGDVRPIKQYLHKYNILKYKILYNINNKYINNIVKNHKVLLHMATKEVFPYSVLESLFTIPCVLNNNTEWAKSFFNFDSCYFANNDVNDIIKKIDNIMECDKEYDVSYNTYINQCMYEWCNFLN